MVKIENIKTKNTLKRFFLALILIAGFALYSNANLSYAEEEAQEMNFGGDIASGEAMYKTLDNGEFEAILEDGTVITRYANGRLKTMEMPTKPNKSTLSCDEEVSVRENVNWLGGIWDYATTGVVVAYNHAQTVVGTAWEVAKGVTTNQTYDETVKNVKDVMQSNAKDVKAHVDETISNFLSTDCRFKGNDGEFEYSLTSHGTIDDDDHALSGCKPMPLKLSEFSTCFLCPLLNIILKACDQMGAIAMNTFSFPIRVLLAVGLAMFISMKVLVHVSSFAKVDGAKFLQELITQSFKVLIAYYLLLHPTAIYDYMVSPILTAALDYGAAITPSKYATAMDASKYVERSSTSILDVQVYEGLMNLLVSIQTKLATTQAIGSTLICTSNTSAMRDIHTLMNFQMFFQGVIIYVFALLLSIAFAFYTIDIIANLGVLFGLMPLLIVAWPFKVTNSYTKKGFNILLTAVFTFIFMGTMAALVIKLIEAAVGGNSSEMIELFNAGDAEKIDQLFDMSGFEFLSLVACALFGFKFMGNVTQFAKTFGGHNARSIASNMAGQGAKMATGAAKKVASPIAKYASKKAGQGLRMGVDRINQGLGTGSDKSTDNTVFTQSQNQDSNQQQNQDQTPKPVKTNQQPKGGTPPKSGGGTNGNGTTPSGGGNPKGNGTPPGGNGDNSSTESEEAPTEENTNNENEAQETVSGKDLDKNDKTRLKNALDAGRKGGVQPKLSSNTLFTKNKNGTISFDADGKNFQVNNDGGLTEIEKNDKATLSTTYNNDGSKVKQANIKATGKIHQTYYDKTGKETNHIVMDDTKKKKK